MTDLPTAIQLSFKVSYWILFYYSDVLMTLCDWIHDIQEFFPWLKSKLNIWCSYNKIDIFWEKKCSDENGSIEVTL